MLKRFIPSIGFRLFVISIFMLILFIPSLVYSVSRTEYVRPLIAGIQIRSQIGKKCSIGFPARLHVGNDYILGFITAKHCIGNPYFLNVYQPLIPKHVGSVYLMSSPSPDDIDLVFVELDPNVGITSKVWWTYTSNRSIKGYLFSWNLKVGEKVVLVGATSGRHYGNIAFFIYGSSGGYTGSVAMAIDYVALHGDSGGFVGFHRRFRGAPLYVIGYIIGIYPRDNPLYTIAITLNPLVYGYNIVPEVSP